MQIGNYDADGVLPVMKDTLPRESASYELPPIDPTVVLPEAVRLAAATANSFYGPAFMRPSPLEDAEQRYQDMKRHYYEVTARLAAANKTIETLNQKLSRRRRSK